MAGRRFVRVPKRAAADVFMEVDPPKKRARSASRKRLKSALNVRTAGFLGQELKFVDSTYDADIATLLSNGEADPTTENCLNGVAEGDGENQRIGRRIIIKRVQMQGHVRYKVTTGGFGGADIMLALVLDTQSNGTQLQAENVFQQIGTETTTFPNLLYEQRFKILKTWRTTLLPTRNYNGTNVTTGGENKIFSWDIPMNIPVTYTGTGATVASIADNSLHVICVSGISNCRLEYDSRVRYVG